MENYEGIKVPEVWAEYYKELSQDDKLEVFAQMFMDVSNEERDLVIKDMRHLFHKDGDHAQSDGKCCAGDHHDGNGEHGHSHSS
jgi:hypothetical protein